MPEVRTPVEELRKAARRMRAQAESAANGPWRAESRPSSAADQVISKTGLEVADCAIEDAEHIASWHPLVALAVAKWLDEVADDRHASLPSWVENGALAIARAYLGTGEQ